MKERATTPNTRLVEAIIMIDIMDLQDFSWIILSSFSVNKKMRERELIYFLGMTLVD